jgi:Virulence-associated protein E-like domain/Bifunctional DNA primase/polymerase, N-terminal/Primase C terminal 2 (PriCT-2)
VPSTQLVDHALRYASLGLYIFPLRKIVNTADGGTACTCASGAKCTAIGKHPAIKWSKEATCAPERVREWWGGRFAGCGIGCATGPSKLVVFDLDGPQGALTMAGLLGGERLVTSRAKTARGWHVFTRGEAPTSSDPVTKLDVRSTGGFVVLAPSPHASGHTYAWEVAPWDTAIAECPPALLEYARTKKGRPAGMSGRQGAKVVNREEPPGKLSGDGITIPEYLRCASPDFGERLDRILNAPDWAEVARALACVPADCGYQDWLQMGMALHSTGIYEGFELWDAWSSKTTEKYPGREALEEKWRSFQIIEGGVGLGSLFDLAFRHGYKREMEVMPNRNDDSTSTPENRPPDDVRAPGAAHVNGETNGVTYALPKELTERPIIWPDLTEEGKRKHTCANAIAAVRGLGIACDGDRFHERYRVGGHIMHEWAGELSDEVVAVVRTSLREEFQFDPGTLAVHDALVAECLANSHHPIKDYFSTLQWDRVPRLDRWMVNYLGASDDAFNRAVGRLSLIAAVRRVLQPGCKFDHIIVLEGPEGRGKSTAIEILAGPENFSDQTILSLDDKAQQEAVSGVWLYEIADLAGHSRAEVEKVKAFASRTTDRARPAYGRRRVDKPRTCVFFATTNDKTYLKSQTGNRRFWPVECGLVNLAQLRVDRDQLWAEAVVAEKGASLFLAEELWGDARERQEARRDADPWDDILEYVEPSISSDKTEERVFGRDIFEKTLKIPVERQTDAINKRLAFAMRRFGWDGPKPIRIKVGDETIRARGYTRPMTRMTPVTLKKD